MTEFEAVIVDEVRGVRLALDRIASALELPATEPASPPIGCQHPEEFRADFGETNGQPDWECVKARGGCGYRSVT